MTKKRAQNLNFSFCPELPKCTEPRHCCKSLKITTVYFITSLLIVVLSLSLLALSFFDLNLIRESDFPIIVLAFLAMFLILTFSSTYGVVAQKPYFILPKLVLMIFVILAITSLSIVLFVLYQNDENVWIILSVVGAVILFNTYYTYIVGSLFKYVRDKKKIEQFIRNQNMFDDVCREMLEEDHQLQMQQMEAQFEEPQLSYEYYESSFCSSESAPYPTPNAMSTFHQSFHQRVTFYDPDEPSF